jgi:trk system potassium uptake protein TrkA
MILLVVFSQNEEGMKMKMFSTWKNPSSNGRCERQMIIVGANDIGVHLAATLGGRGQNIILIDEKEELLQGLNEEVDVMTIVGNPLDRETLLMAGVGKGVRLIAVTDSDELNILLLFLGETLGILEGFALVRNREIYESFLPRMFRSGGRLHLIYLWELVVGEVERKSHLQIRHLYTPVGSSSFLTGVQFLSPHPLVGEGVNQLKLGIRSRVLQGFQHGRFFPIAAGMKIEAGMVLLCEMEESEQERGMRSWGSFDRQHKVVVGGTQCLQAFQRHWPSFFRDLVCIENNLTICQHLLNMSSRALVLRGDGLNITLLKEEARIEDAELFLAASEQDEVNLLSSLIAKSYQVKNVLTLLHRRQHSGMLERISLDGIIAIPQLIANHFHSRLWPNRTDLLPLSHLDVQINTDTPPEGFTLVWRNGAFHPLRDHLPQSGELITIVKV